MLRLRKQLLDSLWTKDIYKDQVTQLSYSVSLIQEADAQTLCLWEAGNEWASEKRLENRDSQGL